MAATFTSSNIGYVINTIEDLLITMDSQNPLNISTTDSSFVKLYFSLKNGNVEIEIHDDEAFCTYKVYAGENSKSTKFYQRYLTDASSNESLYKALKEIRDFDRQQVNILKSDNTSIDRASFGLAEVN
jgi:hypothetical protein